MKLGDLGRQDAQYRRGLVLGLTVAEAMLLILFALLLALATLLLKREQKIVVLTARLSDSAHQLVEAKARNDVLQTFVEKRPPDGLVKELVRAREHETAVAEREKTLERRAKDLEKDTALAEALAPSRDKRDRVRDLAAIGARLEKELKKVSPTAEPRDAFEAIPAAVAAADAAAKAGYSPKESREAFQRADKAARDNATLKGQVVRLRNDLAKVGKGATTHRVG